MFICEDCSTKNLSRNGISHVWPKSRGTCEICENPGICNDVPSSRADAWKTDEEDDSDPFWPPLGE